MDSLEVREQDGCLHLRLAGEVTLEAVREIKRTIETRLDRVSGFLVADLSRVQSMDSSGIGFLVALDTRMKERGSRLVIYRPSSHVLKIFDLVRLRDLFLIAENEDALSAVTNG
jgi:anti-sigma B factor antagonist